MPTVGDVVLTYDQLETYVIEIEAILSSRPLSLMSSGSNDLLPVKHLLIAGPMTTLPNIDFNNTPTNKSSIGNMFKSLNSTFGLAGIKNASTT